MDRFSIWLGRSSYIKKEGLEVGIRTGETKEEYLSLGDEEKYDAISISCVTPQGEIDYMLIGQHYHVEELLGKIKDDPLFQREGHFTVKGRLEEKNWEFDGTLFDALLVIANEGAKYDI